MSDLITWLEGTSLNATFQNVWWIIPASQSIHILAVALIMSSAMIVNLHMAGVTARGVLPRVISRRYLRGIWIALPLLLATGLLQIVAEPRRDLANAVFWWKMGLLLTALLLTWLVQYPLRRDERFWDIGERRVAVRILSWGTLAVWVAIVFAGRWIAYTYIP